MKVVPKGPVDAKLVSMLQRVVDEHADEIADEATRRAIHRLLWGTDKPVVLRGGLSVDSESEEE